MNPALVVARFDEPIAWLCDIPHQDFHDVTIMNMGSKDGGQKNQWFREVHIKDAGRESYAYCQFILENYDRLLEWVVFCQATPFDHMDGDTGFLQWLRTLPKLTENPHLDIILAGKQRFAPIDERLPMMSHLLARSPLVPYELDPLDGGQFLARHPMVTLWMWLFGPGVGTPFENWQYCWGNQFAVRRELILSKPLTFWTRLASCLEHAPKPLEACILERLWPSILRKEV